MFCDSEGDYDGDRDGDEAEWIDDIGDGDQ
jgi:hypothetical protein